MKWILLAVLIWVVASGRGKVAELMRTAKKFPKHYRDGQASIDDPVKGAKDITPSKDRAPPP